MTAAFHYPAHPLTRRHGPRGYADVRKYKPWLRDEFTFRCIYCLDRETWHGGELEIEHFLPTGLVPDLMLDYDNLLYACRTCNGMKANQSIPNPMTVLLHDAIKVEANGLLTAGTPDAERIIEQLALNADRRREYRRMWMRVLDVVAIHDANLFQMLTGYPMLLPDLDRLKPPGGNTRPEGLETSYRTRRLRGELPELY